MRYVHYNCKTYVKLGIIVKQTSMIQTTIRKDGRLLKDTRKRLS